MIIRYITAFDFSIACVLLTSRKNIFRVVIFPLLVGVLLGVPLAWSGSVFLSSFQPKTDELLWGNLVLRISGVEKGISLKLLNETIAYFSLLTFFLITFMWNIVRSYRALIGYMKRSGVLLPLFAAVTPERVYGTIIAVCILSSILFILATCFTALMVEPSLGNLELLTLPIETMGILKSLSWFIALLAGSFSVILVSLLAEGLSKRRWIGEFCMIALPIVSLLCTFMWAGTFFDEVVDLSSSNANSIIYNSPVFVRTLISLVPITGFIPIVLGPVFNTNVLVFILHGVLSFMCVKYIFNRGLVKLPFSISEL